MKDFVESAKGIVSVIRDGLITLVLILLLMMPKTINDRLMAAGVKKASIAGFDWEATVKDNNENWTLLQTRSIRFRSSLE
jgi:hypothetical protein